MMWLPSLLMVVLQVALPLPFTGAGLVVPLVQVRLTPPSVNVTDPAFRAMSDEGWELITTKSFIGAGGDMVVNGGVVYEVNGDVVAGVGGGGRFGVTEKVMTLAGSVGEVPPVWVV